MIFTPHNYQAYCIDRVINDPALGLMLEMGLGKTVITLTAIQDLRYNRFEVHKALVIAPKKVAEATWSREAQKWDHLQGLRILPVLGTVRRRTDALHTPADIYVINRENIPWLVDYYRNNWPFDMVVCDEFSSFKNPSAKRTKALNMVRPHINRIVGLTGTPAPNGLLDLWSQINLLDQGERLGKSYYGFRERYFTHNQYSHETKAKPEAEAVVWERISDICVSMKAADYLELPDIVYNTIPVVLDDRAQRLYDEMERDMIMTVDENTIDAGSAAVLTGKLIQLCNGSVYDENRKVVHVHDCKIEAFLELLEQLNGRRALGFYSYQHDLTAIHAALKGKGLRVREMSTPDDETAWNNGEIDILLVHPASAAYGLNLQDGGNHVIWFGLTWNLEHYQQANARLHRQGQTEKVIVHHLAVDGGMDEDILAVLESKGDTQERLMTALKARIEKTKKVVAA